MSENLENSIVANPDGVYQSPNGNFVFHQGENVVVTHGPGSSQGNIITSYGPAGPRNDSGAAALGGLPTDPGLPVTSDMILNGGIPASKGGYLPPATLLY